eukprot:26140-Pleurochrysis_carterae.AAC.1
MCYELKNCAQPEHQHVLCRANATLAVDVQQRCGCWACWCVGTALALVGAELDETRLPNILRTSCGRLRRRIHRNGSCDQRSAELARLHWLLY